MPRIQHERIDRARTKIGAALLEVQNLGKRHREAVTKLETAYMELAELTTSPVGCADCVQDVA